MSLSGYDLRKRGGPRQTWRLRPRWRFPTPRELRLAGFVVYAGFVAWVMFGCDQLAARRQLSAWLGDRPVDRACSLTPQTKAEKLSCPLRGD